MYQIKEFSILSETTIKTLRYYDKINLLKPVKVNNLTGYRYYDEKQIETMKKIKKLKQAGFSLKEIKDLLKTKNQDILTKKIKEIEYENKEKIKILQKMESNMKENTKLNTPKFIINPNITAVGIPTVIKSRRDIPKILKKVDKVLAKYHLEKNDMVFINYEIGYKEKNITCFIGRTISKSLSENHHYIIKFNKDHLKMFDEKKVPTMMHIRIEKNENIDDSYKEIIKYANKNNIQIRGSFIEIYKENYIDIYIESYDLEKENEDELKHRKEMKEKLKNINKHDKKFIGKWELVGQIIEPPYQFNPKKEHYKPDTIYNIIELKEDGTTNFKNITWNDKYIIMKNNEKAFYSYITKTYKKGFTKYLEILINDENSNSRPYEYYYKKIK